MDSVNRLPDSKREQQVRAHDQRDGGEDGRVDCQFQEYFGNFRKKFKPVIIVEEMDKSTAKQRVFDFMKEHKTSDIEELHENIRCDIQLLIEIIDELCAEGAILGDQ